MKKYIFFTRGCFFKPIILSYQGLEFQNKPFYKYKIAGGYTLSTIKIHSDVDIELMLHLHPFFFKKEVKTLTTYLNLKGVKFLPQGLLFSNITHIEIS